MIKVKTNMGKMGKAGGSLAQEMEKEIKTDYFFTFLCPPAVKKLGGWRTRTISSQWLECRVSHLKLGPTDYQNF